MAVWSTKSEDTTFNVMAVIVNRFPSRPIILNITVMTPLMVEVNFPVRVATLVVDLHTGELRPI